MYFDKNWFFLLFLGILIGYGSAIRVKPIFAKWAYEVKKMDSNSKSPASIPISKQEKQNDHKFHQVD